MKESYIFLADGFEEIEALTPVDVMRRAGMAVKTVSVSESKSVVGAHGIRVEADMTISELSNTEAAWLVLPGGMPGATNLYACDKLKGMLTRQAEVEGGRIAAICASPGVVLGQLGLLAGREATCYPGFESMMPDARYTAAAVTADDRYVLGNGPANALRWSLTIVEEACGSKKANEIAAAMQLK